MPPQGEPIPVGKSPTVVGRDAACDIAVSHHSISRRHALVERSGSEWAVADQNSANGTWIDGQRIIRAYLRHGQHLRFGAVAFDVKLEEGVASVPPEPRARPKPAAAGAPVVPAPPMPMPTPKPTPTPTPTPTSDSDRRRGGSLQGTRGGAAGDRTRGLGAGDPAAVPEDLQRLPDPPDERADRQPQADVPEEPAGAEGRGRGAGARAAGVTARRRPSRSPKRHPAKINLDRPHGSGVASPT